MAMSDVEPRMRETARSLRPGVLLAAVAAAATGLLVLVYQGTTNRIAANERAYVLRNLADLLPPTRYDNDPLSDQIALLAPGLLGTTEPVTAWRARRSGQPVAVILQPVAPDGYSGPIRLMVAIDYDGRISGVRTLSHRETPGLGDAIERRRSDWILGFNGRSLRDPDRSAWLVRQDGGQFDQFTGATVTPRAVVKAVRNALIYFEENRDAIFQAPPDTRLSMPDEAPESR
jgi:electron transport complex protein RnfG